MSAPLTRATTLWWQRAYACAGFYAGNLDGHWGWETDRAAEAWDAAYEQLRDRYGRLDGRSESGLRTLLPALQESARAFLQRAAEAGFDARIISATRTYEEQDALFAQGRTQPGRIVTKAKGGLSAHNFGVAFDVGLFADRTYVTAEKPYKRLAEISPPLRWGGAWPDFPDYPHYQLVELPVAVLRANFEAGKGFT